MPKLNPLNERIKRDYARHLKAAHGKSAVTVDAVLKAIARFEDYTGARDFKTFRREQAIAFKERLASTTGSRSGEVLSASTQASTLAALKDFFRWLAWQPGFKSKIHVPISNISTLRIGTLAWRRRSGCATSRASTRCAPPSPSCRSTPWSGDATAL